MKIKTIEVYYCDFCNKLYQRKHACEWHEKHCKNNTLNHHACFRGCGNLIKNIVDCDYDEEESYGITSFHCKLTGQKMYSYIAERRELSCVNDDDYIRMPLICTDSDTDWYGLIDKLRRL